jgi:Fe-S-cluster containining protein
MERRFNCTACGKCCHGWIPLTLKDAIGNAARFPLALVWTAVPHGVRAFALTSHLGVTIRLPKRRQVAALIAPTAYLPPTYPCPELSAENRCGIHADKPLRCRTMPFYAYRPEQDQADLLVPSGDWACDTSEAAPVVYRDGNIVDRTDFDLERAELVAQAPTMRAYGEYALKYMPGIVASLAACAEKRGGNVVTSLSSFLTATKLPDAKTVAAHQLPLFREYAARTAGNAELAEYHRNFSGWAREMEYLAG